MIFYLFFVYFYPSTKYSSINRVVEVCNFLLKRISYDTALEQLFGGEGYTLRIVLCVYVQYIFFIFENYYCDCSE